jgi:hypothetical protein
MSFMVPFMTVSFAHFWWTTRKISKELKYTTKTVSRSAFFFFFNQVFKFMEASLINILIGFILQV